jgi:shikimate kinase
MAAGKSTIGKRLAQDLGLPFIDTDEVIAARHGPIAEIFAREGDAGFRAREFEVVRETLEGAPAVVALGGGAVTYQPTRALVADHAVRVFLDVAESTLLERLSRSTTNRPMLGGSLDPAHVRGLLEKRLPLYREAEIVVQGHGRSKATIVREIVARLQER